MAMMDGVFWHNGFGFVVARRWAESHFPDRRKIDRTDIALRLEASGRLPNLAAAPVASWLVARLFELTRQRLGFETHARLRNDGGSIPLHLIAFTECLKPVAFLDLRADSTGIEFWGECAADIDPDQITSVFLSALLAHPDALVKCKLTTIDTDPPDLPHRRVGEPHVFGWNGTRFLGQRIEEDRIVADAIAAAAHEQEETSARAPLIEISEALVPSIIGVSIPKPLTVKELHALLGPPSRILEPKLRAPVGHRSQHHHVYDPLGLIFCEHHYTQRIEYFEIVFRPEEQRMLSDQPPPSRFPGTLRLAGFTFPADVPDLDVVLRNCPAFFNHPSGTRSVSRDGFAVHLDADGHKLPGGGRTKRLQLVSVSLSWPHDPWGDPAAD
jgi:hypothetical protein